MTFDQPISEHKSLTVMMVSFATTLGGAERSLLALATHLPEQSITPVLVCPAGPFAEVSADLGVRVEVRALSSPRPIRQYGHSKSRYSVTAVMARTRNSLTDAVLLWRAARTTGAELIYSNSLPGHVPSALAGQMARRPVLWHLREIVKPGRGRRALSLVGRLTVAMIAISDAVAACMRHPFITTIYNPVAEPPPQIRRPSWKLTKPVVGYLGRIDPRKGIEDLVAAAENLDADIAIVGDLDVASAGYVSTLRALVADNASQRVHFLGSVDDPWSALAEFDVLVVPSIAEPFGRVAAEGQRAGIPIVAADAGGLPEIVTDNVDGLLYPPGDIEALCGAVTKLLGDRTLASRLAAAGRVSSRRFDPAHHAAAVSSIFRLCVRTSHQGR